MKTSRKDDSLPGLLHAWQVSPRPSAHFSTDVWREIEAKRASQTWRAYARGHPTLVAMVVMLAAIAGGWGGRETAEKRVEARSAAMADAYVQGMDPRQMTMP